MATDQVVVTVNHVDGDTVEGRDMEIENFSSTTPQIKVDMDPSIIVTPTPPPNIVSSTAWRHYEFQPPSSNTTSCLLGADLSSTSTTIMAPPKLNTVKKSRILVNPGKSMVEWMKIQQQFTAKGPTQKLRRIGVDELARHNTFGDTWMAINDRVFDISDYANYHPGGVEEIMKGAGQDGTSLFNQVHRWVNFESILRGNFLGFLVKEPTLAVVRKLNSGLTSGGVLSSLPSTKFSEDDDSVFLEIDSQMVGDVRQESWTVGLLNRERLMLKVMVKPPKVWITHLQLLKALTDDHINVNYQNDFKRILITLKKPQQGRWMKLGMPLTDHNQLLDSRTTVEDMYPTKFIRKKSLTRNTALFTAVTHTAVIGVPIGFHVQIRLKENVTRSFTPIILSITDREDTNTRSVTQNSQELHFIIKTYSDGQFTSLLEKSTSDSEYQTIDVELGFPRGHFDTSFFNNLENLCLLAGGTGITPFIRIIHYLYCRRRSIPIQKVVLLLFNETSEDIIWAEDWKNLATKEPSWFYFYPVISKPQPSEPWTGFTGRISTELFENCIQDCLPYLSPSTIIGESKAMICGSYGFNASCKGVLKQQSVLKIDDPTGIFIFNG